MFLSEINLLVSYGIFSPSATLYIAYIIWVAPVACNSKSLTVIVYHATETVLLPFTVVSKTKSSP